MQIIINGEKKEINDSTSIDKIILDYGINRNNCIVELNGHCLSQENQEDQQRFLKPLQEGDQLELIRFIGGG